MWNDPEVLSKRVTWSHLQSLLFSWLWLFSLPVIYFSIVTSSEFFITSRACELIFEGNKEEGGIGDVCYSTAGHGGGREDRTDVQRMDERMDVVATKRGKRAASLTPQKDENSSIWEPPVLRRSWRPRHRKAYGLCTQSPFISSSPWSFRWLTSKY